MHPFTISPRKKSFEFLTKVFDTVADTFPSKFVHIGGDEAPSEQLMEVNWENLLKEHRQFGADLMTCEVLTKERRAFMLSSLSKKGI